MPGSPSRRLKTYSAQSGYVYHYYYAGFQEAGLATEYLFDTSANRREWFQISVALEEEAVRAWEASHGRELTSSERYAAAKLALFAAFDQREHPDQMRAGVRVTPDCIEDLLGPLEL